MRIQRKRSWWGLLLQGLAAILFAVLVIVWPTLTLRTLVLLFGVYALVDGIAGAVATLVRRDEEKAWWVALTGSLLSLAVGLITLIWPHLTAMVLLYLIAARAILLGLLQVVRAIQWRREIDGAWLLALGGLLSIAFGVIAFVVPGSGALALIWVIGVYAAATGIVWIALALRARRWPKPEQG